MKILRIRFKNIHSLKGEFTIDFEAPPLSDTGIFAIVGATGSGKSTLLDVIMLALFGQMPRFSEKISKSTVEKFGTVLTRGTAESYAEVEYRTKGKEYRSHWGISVARTGNLRDYSMELAELPTGKLIEDYKSNVPSKNEEIIGLNYEQFLKSIILAQGDFSKFLKSKPEERTQILEKITGTGIYRIIGKRSYEIAKDFNEELKNKRNLLQNFEVLSDELIKNMKEQKNDFVNKVNNFKTQQKSFNEIFVLKKQILENKHKLRNLEAEENINKKEIEDFKIFEEEIILHEKLVNLKADLFEVENLSDIIASTKQKIDLEQKKIVDFGIKIEQINKEIKYKELKLEKLTEKSRESAPFVLEAKELDRKIELAEQEIEQKKSEFLKIESQSEQINSKIKSFEQINQELNIRKGQLQEWLEKNKILEDLNDDIIFISESLKNYAEAKKISEKAISESIFKNDFLRNEWRYYQEIAEKLIYKNTQELSVLRKEFEEGFINMDLNLVLDKKISELQNMEKMLALSAELKETDKQINDFNENIADRNNEKKDLESKLLRTRNELEITVKKIEELEKRLERERLEAKYEQDRLLLEEEKPCPLCGAINHPYARKIVMKGTDVTKQKLEETKHQKSDLEKTVLLLSNEKSSVETNINNFEKNINELRQKKEQLVNAFATMNKNTGENFIYKEKEKIEDYYKKILREKNKIQEQIKIKDRLQILSQQNKELQHIKEKIDLTFSRRQENSERLKKYKSFYVGEKNNEGILHRLREFLSEYKRNIEQKSKMENDISTNIQVIEQLKIQQDDNKKQKLTTEKELVRFQNNIDLLKKKLKKIEHENLDSLSFDSFEKKINNDITFLREELAENNSLLAGINAKLSEKKEMLKELESLLLEKNNDFEQKNNLLKSKLSEIGINSVKEALKNILPEEKYTELKRKAKTLYDRQNILKENISQMKSLLEEMEKRDDSEKDYEQIKEEIRTIEQNIEELNIEIGKITNKLENDNHQRDKLQSLLNEIEKLSQEAERWQKLSFLIGDSTGKKFAEIAQQFTLTHLLFLANKHLKNFSERYKLDKTAETKNNLFVYDNYQGMNRRSVHTLSGGETFLVSLSLALALSDLASQKTRIESLFIDEGFATLDEETLDNALVNLEKLHADSDRTIGLISHVADIKERINTKIVLEKDNSGFSTLRIEN